MGKLNNSIYSVLLALELTRVYHNREVISYGLNSEWEASIKNSFGSILSVWAKQLIGNVIGVI